MSNDLRFKSWSASRLDDYNVCPFFAKLKHLLKMCPTCFKGSLRGYPKQVCDTCKKPRKMPKVFERGGKIGESLERYVNGQGSTLHKEIKHPAIVGCAHTLRSRFKEGAVKVEMQVNLSRTFKILPPGWSPDIWLITKLDVWHRVDGAYGEVLDWKTGGLDKRTGEIKANDKYDDQLLTYKVTGFCLFPDLKKVGASLGFVDAPTKSDPFIVRDPLVKEDLNKAKQKLVQLSMPIMSDRTFAPNPNYRCDYCDYRKAVGGPCKFGDRK